jgi:hypothetical protein
MAFRRLPLSQLFGKTEKAFNLGVYEEPRSPFKVGGREQLINILPLFHDFATVHWLD